MWTSTVPTIAAASFLLSSASAAGLYTKSSPVINVDSGSYKRLIANSNYTSIVEFYAPWCGHCKSLKPAFEKAATNLKGLAKVAAVNCDDEENKPLCGQFGVQGFPTLKIFRPGKKAGNPVVEDYQMQRTAKAIVDAVVEKMPNHIKKLTDKTFDDWLAQKNETAKAILFTEKGTTSALAKALAIDFLGSISFAQGKHNLAVAKDTFGITSFPTIVLLPGGDKESIVYSGDMTKEALSEFFGQVATPNPDPAPVAPKAKKEKKDTKKDKKAESQFSKASKSHKASEKPVEATSIDVEPVGQPTESPSPEVEHEKPAQMPMIKSLTSVADLDEACFSPKSGTCILAILPATDESGVLPEDCAKAMSYLSDVQAKLTKRAKVFPFYAISIFNNKAATIRQKLSLKGQDQFELIAVNAKRSWYRRFAGSDFSLKAIDDWVDAIKMNEGKRETLPEGLVVGAAPKPAAEKAQQPKDEATLEMDSSEFVMDEQPAPVQPAEPEGSPVPEATPETVISQPEAADPEPPQEPTPDRDEL